MLVFLDFKCLSFFFELNGNLDVYRALRLSAGIVVFVFDVHASIRTYLRSEATLEVNKRNEVAALVFDEQPRHTSLCCHAGIVGAKRWSSMHDSCTVFGSNKISANDAKSFLRIFCRLCKSQQLLVFEPNKILPLTSSQNGVWNLFVSGVVII